MRIGKKISEHINYTEATKSNTAVKYGIDNTPDSDTLNKMEYLAESIFEPVREHLGVPIAVTSFYRSIELNKKLGGAKDSQHTTGEAMDLDADVYGIVTNKEIFDYIKNNLDFDQLIWEFGTNREPSWVHVSLKESNNRNMILKAYKEKDWRGRLVTKYTRL